MEGWKSDNELFKLIRAELFTAVVGDIMDKMGYLSQFLPPQIQPLRDDMLVAGRAMTVLEADSFGDSSASTKNTVMQRHFGLMLDALDDLKENEIYVCTGSSPSYAVWGELMSVRAMKLGAVGAIVNGYSRDTDKILELGFPTFSLGRYAQDQAPRGKVIDFRVPIKIGAVSIHPGDILIGDIDGVCVVPQVAEIPVIRGALEKVRGERAVKDAMLAGMSAKAAFDKFGIM